MIGSAVVATEVLDSTDEEGWILATCWVFWWALGRWPDKRWARIGGTAEGGVLTEDKVFKVALLVASSPNVFVCKFTCLLFWLIVFGALT